MDFFSSINDLSRKYGRSSLVFILALTDWNSKLFKNIRFLPQYIKAQILIIKIFTYNDKFSNPRTSSYNTLLQSTSANHSSV